MTPEEQEILEEKIQVLVETLPDTPETVLQEANRLITSNRNGAYGAPSVVFEKYAVGWSQIIGAPVTAKQVALCMAWLKLMREVNKHQRDNLVDLAGYAGLAGRIDGDDNW